MSLHTPSSVQRGGRQALFLWRLAFLLGSGLFASALVCWVAANWPHASAFQKLAGVQALLVITALLAVWRVWRKPDDIGMASVAANALGLAAVLVGGMFALIGQIYQTGADPWQLFALWAVLLLPWCLALPTIFMLSLFAVVLNAALALFLMQAWHWSWEALAGALAAVNLLMLACREGLGQKLGLEDAWRIAPRALMAAVLGWWLTGFLFGLIDDAPGTAALGWAGMLLGGAMVGVYTRVRTDVAMLSMLGLTACVALCALIFAKLGFQEGLLLAIILLVLAFVFGARHLLAIVRAGRARVADDHEPWFISAFRLILLGLAALLCLLFVALVLEMNMTAIGVLGIVMLVGGIWGLRTALDRPAARDLFMVVLVAGYALYIAFVLESDLGYGWGQTLLIVLPSLVIYLLCPVFILRFGSALFGVGVVLMQIWGGYLDGVLWRTEDTVWFHMFYERLLALSLVALAVWHWVGFKPQRQGHVALAWALTVLALVCGWWTPALRWGEGVPTGAWVWIWTLALLLALLPLYALYRASHGMKPVLRLGSMFVLLVASVGWMGAPGVAVSLTWLLMGYVLKRRSMLVLSGLAVITYLAQFYYQLETPLLQKAWVLGATGLWLLLAVAVLGWRRSSAPQSAQTSPTAGQGRGRAYLRAVILLVALLLILGVANTAVVQKERVWRQGQPVVLELAPVDPRSLMQGDYMVLRYGVALDIATQLEEDSDLAQKIRADGRGRMVLLPNDQHVHELLRIEPWDAATVPPEEGALKLAFRLRGDDVWVVTDAWFFPEGQAEHYEQARYGLFRVDAQGNGLLVDLLDEDARPLKSRLAK